MTFQNDPNLQNRNLNNRSRLRDSPGMSWGLPLGVAVVVLAAGLLFFNWSDNRTTTASSTSPITTQSTPAPMAPTTTPAPAPTPSSPKGG